MTYEKTRQIRRSAYARIVLASTAETHLPRVALDGPLADVFRAFDLNEGGVWCSGAADILRRVYLEEGFRSWKYTYGSGSPVTHAVTLVEVDGRVYLQDAYFNVDYVDERSEPLPFFDLLDRLAQRRPPRVRQDVDTRKGLFLSPENAKEWVSPELHDRLVCESTADGRLICRFAMRFDVYRASHMMAPAVSTWLSAAAYPDDWSYLLLHPRPGQKFLSIPRGAPAGPLVPDRELAAEVLLRTGHAGR